MNCTTHNLIPAKLQCAECGHYLCSMCIRIVEVNGEQVHLCAHCGGRTIILGSLARQEQDSSRKEFWGELAGIFAYPLRGAGLINLIIGTIFLVIMNFVAAFTSLFFLAGVFLAIIVTGYLFKYYTTVVQTSAKGEKKPPGWGDVEVLDLWDLIRTFFRTIFVVIFSFGAPIVLYYYLGIEDNPAILFALIALGIFYFPMAFLAVAYYENIKALNPIAIFKSMGRAFGHYFVVVMSFYILLGLDWLLQSFISSEQVLGDSNIFLAMFVNRFVSLYLLTSLMHLLGIYLFYNRQRLNWQ